MMEYEYLSPSEAHERMKVAEDYLYWFNGQRITWSHPCYKTKGLWELVVENDDEHILHVTEYELLEVERCDKACIQQRCRELLEHLPEDDWLGEYDHLRGLHEWNREAEAYRAKQAAKAQP